MKFFHIAVLFAPTILAATENMQSTQKMQAMQAEPADTINQLLDTIEANVRFRDKKGWKYRINTNRYINQCPKVPKKCTTTIRKLLGGEADVPPESGVINLVGTLVLECIPKLSNCAATGVLGEGNPLSQIVDALFQIIEGN